MGQRHTAILLSAEMISDRWLVPMSNRMALCHSWQVPWVVVVVVVSTLMGLLPTTAALYF